MKGVTWQVVAVVLIAVAGGVFLYVAVPAGDPARGALLTVLNGVASGMVVYFLGRRQDRTETKVDQMIEHQEHHANGDAHPTSAHPPVVTRAPEQR